MGVWALLLAALPLVAALRVAVDLGQEEAGSLPRRGQLAEPPGERAARLPVSESPRDVPNAGLTNRKLTIFFEIGSDRRGLVNLDIYYEQCSECSVEVLPGRRSGVKLTRLPGVQGGRFGLAPYPSFRLGTPIQRRADTEIELCTILVTSPGDELPQFRGEFKESNGTTIITTQLDAVACHDELRLRLRERE